jgi:N-acetylglucosaminyldiphosphoundecaprenol N-acetyl-beta-D-mannosaminyltransferase
MVGNGSTERVSVLGCPVDALDMPETVERCLALIDRGQPAQHVVVNAAKLVEFNRNERMAQIIKGCELVNADGQSIVWAARLLGRELPGRVAGIDLMHELLAAAAERGLRVFLLGARPEVLTEAERRLKLDNPRLVIAGTHHGWFSESENDAVVRAIRDARPDMLFVAMSSPRKEYWLSENLRELHVPFAMGVGGALDVVAGVSRRAPRWLQRVGLEWAWRLVQEPRRLGRRYLVSNLRFTALVVRERLARR